MQLRQHPQERRVRPHLVCWPPIDRDAPRKYPVCEVTYGKIQYTVRYGTGEPRLRGTHGSSLRESEEAIKRIGKGASGL